MDEVPDSLKADAARLEYLSLRLVFAVIDHPVDTKVQRIYSAEPSMPAHKIVIKHNSSDYLKSLPHHGITGEVSYSSEKILTGRDIEDRFVENLLELKLIREAQVIRTSSVDVKYAYPAPTFGRDAIVRRLKAWLEARRIYSIGRFGEWAYINSDGAIIKGGTLGCALGGSWQGG